MVLALLCPAAQAAVISINFNRNADEVFAASIGAGAVFVTNWNQMAPQTTGVSGTNVALVDDSGAAVGTTVTYTAANTWAQGGPNPADGNISLLKGYIDDGANSITVSNIGYTLYDVYVYGLGDGAVGSALGNYTLTPQGQGPITFSWLRAANPTAGGTLLEGSAGVQGHYYKISGLSASSFSLTSFDGNTANGRGPIAGIQIVEVPEPSAALLLPLSLLSLRRRKRH